MAYYFNLPTDAEITEHQRSAINDTDAIALTGGPGTGKSVVSVYRHLNNYKFDIRKSVLLTYTKSLRFYLANSIRSEIPKSISKQEQLKLEQAYLNVDKSFSWVGVQCDEIIIDEAQDLSENQIGEWIYGNLTYIKNYSQRISFGADNNQILYRDKATGEDRLREIFPNNRSHFLEENFRNTYEILNFAKCFFEDFIIPTKTLEFLLKDNKRGQKPIFKIVQNESEQNKIIIQIIKSFINTNNTHNIAILLPLIHAARSITRTVRYFYNMLVENNLNCSYFENDTTETVDIQNIHVCTFKSSKGLEFDTVIIPDFHFFSDNIANLRIIKEEDYYVAFTRAKSNLFLISNQYLDFIDIETIDIE